MYYSFPALESGPNNEQDWLDPRSWTFPETQIVVLHKSDASVCCVIDYEDWHWVSLYRWYLLSPSLRGRNKLKPYAVRNVFRLGRPPYRVFLHKEILTHAVGGPPTPYHYIGDHKDSDSLNNRRSNLRWATLTENRQNRDGAYAYAEANQFRLGL
jgi:hypothetical protein